MKQARTKNKAWRRVRWAVALSALAVLAVSPAWAEGRGSCAIFEIPWAITLPDGSAYEAGDLTLCLQQMWTPASGLHEIRIDGTSNGLFMSRAGESEGQSSRRPVAVFQLNGMGEHRLIGYAWPSGDVMRTYMLHEFGKKPQRIEGRASLPLLESDNVAILMAALTR